MYVFVLIIFMIMVIILIFNYWLFFGFVKVMGEIFWVGCRDDGVLVICSLVLGFE